MALENISIVPEGMLRIAPRALHIQKYPPPPRSFPQASLGISVAHYAT